MQSQLEILRPQRTAKGLPEIRMRVGVATGHMIVGNINSEKILNTPVLATRLIIVPGWKKLIWCMGLI